MTGSEIYSRRLLAIYDLWVIAFSARWLWGCPSSKILELYDKNVSGNHLDVGVGTGYFLDKCRFPVPQPRVTLLDLNPNSLEVTSRRIARYHPTLQEGNILEKLPVLGPFDSLGMNFLLHCLPGPMPIKAKVFDHLKPSLRPGAVIFGSTILGKGVPHTGPARAVMRAYQAKGIFGNAEDDRSGLENILRAHFSEVHVQIVGTVALFRAVN